MAKAENERELAVNNKAYDSFLWRSVSYSSLPALVPTWHFFGLIS